MVSLKYTKITDKWPARSGEKRLARRQPDEASDKERRDSEREKRRHPEPRYEQDNQRNAEKRDDQ